MRKFWVYTALFLYILTLTPEIFPEAKKGRFVSIPPTPTEILATVQKMNLIQPDIISVTVITPNIQIATQNIIVPIVGSNISTSNATDSLDLTTTTLYTADISTPNPVQDLPIYSKTSTIDLLIDGYYETKISKRDYNPKSMDSPLYDTIQNDPIYLNLPRDIRLGDPRLETRYKFNIEGRLSDRLSLYWDVEQEPDFPGKYDIRVKYDNSELAFGDIQAEFKNGEFIQVNRALNGLKATSYDKGWSGIVAMGKQRSEPKKFTINGITGKKIGLGNTSILEGSVIVYLNDKVKTEGVDYSVNYFEGEINFTNPIQRDDYVKVIYEYTNPIEDFVPIPNRRNFVGAQYIWAPVSALTETQLATQSYTESFVVSGNMIDTSGVVQLSLKNYPIVLGSELVLKNQRYLKKDKMYYLKTLTGKLVFPPNSLEIGDEINISYDFYPTHQVSENIIAQGTQGPYLLSHPFILKSSLSCTVNAMALQEDRDYTVDYTTGKLYFKYAISYPKSIQLSYTYKENKISTFNQESAPLSVGVTFLDESVNQKTDTLIASAYLETPTITGNALYIQNPPISPSSSVSVLLNGVTANVTSVNYYLGRITVSDTLTGKTAQVSYTYQKPYSSVIIFSGKDTKIWYESINNDFELKNVPVKYHGVFDVSIWDDKTYTTETHLTEGIDYELDYQDGNSLRIRFLTKTDTGLKIGLAYYPTSKTTIKIKYYYTPVSPNGGNVYQRMIGVTSRVKIDENWTIGTELVSAQHNFSKPRSEPVTATFNGTGIANATYRLSHTNLVEDSSYEAVYFNNSLKQKDSDYYINYQQGTIRFASDTPGTDDIIKVIYQYYTSGTTQESETLKNTYAFKVDSTYQLGDIDFFGDIKLIDKNFFPIGEISETKGTFALGGGLQWNFSKKENLYFDYHHRQIYKTINNENKDVNLNRDTFYTRLSMFIWDSIDSTQELTYETEVQDPLTVSNNIHEIDQQKIVYNSQSSFGPDYAITTVSGKLSLETQDYLDRLLLQERKIGYVGLRWDLSLPKSVSAIKKLTSQPYIYYTLDYTRQDQVTDVTRRSLLDEIINYGIKNEFQPIDMISVRLDYDQTNIKKSPDETLDILRNMLSQVSFTPFNWLDTGFEYTHSEAESPLLRQKGKTEDRTTYAIRQYQPYESLGVFGNPTFMMLGTPVKGSRFSSRWNTIRATEYNGKKTYDRDYVLYEYRSFQPIPGITFNKIGYEHNQSNSLSTVETSSASSNRSDSTMTKKDGELTVAPPIFLLNLFNYNIRLSDKTEFQNNFDFAYATNNSSAREIPEFSRNQKLGFSPGSLMLGLPFYQLNLGKFSASVGEDYLQNYDITTLSYSSNLITNTTGNQTFDNKNTKTFLYEAGYSPFNIFDLTAQYRDNWSYYNRNINSSFTGSLYHMIKEGTLTGVYTPFQFISFSGNYNKNYTLQWSNTIPNIDRDLLQSVYTEKLFIDRTKKGGDITLTPFDLISVKGGMAILTIEQAIDPAGDQSDIQQDILISGLILRPLKDMTLSADYLSKKIYENKVAYGTSYSTIAIAEYTPKILQNFSISISGRGEYTSGKDLNDLDIEATYQGTQKISAWQIIDRNDLQVLGSISADLDVPVTSVQYVEKIIFSASGKIKKIVDYNKDNNSYDISWMMISGKILF